MFVSQWIIDIDGSWIPWGSQCNLQMASWRIYDKTFLRMINDVKILIRGCQSDFHLKKLLVFFFNDQYNMETVYEFY